MLNTPNPKHARNPESLSPQHNLNPKQANPEPWTVRSVAGICFFASGMGFAYDAEAFPCPRLGFRVKRFRLSWSLYGFYNEGLGVDVLGLM